MSNFNGFSFIYIFNLSSDLYYKVSLPTQKKTSLHKEYSIEELMAPKKYNHLRIDFP